MGASFRHDIASKFQVSLVFTPVICLGLVALAQAAFKIPRGQPDGVYNHHVDEKGSHVHTKLANIAPAPHRWAKPGKQHKRWDYGSYKERRQLRCKWGHC